MKSLSMAGTIATAWLCGACGSGGVHGDITASINGAAVEVDQFDAQVRSVTGGTQLTLSAQDGNCAAWDANDALTATVLAVDPGAVPLGEPFDVTSEELPFIIGLGANHGDCGHEAGVLSGTITFTELTETSARGSLDLRSDDAPNECGDGSDSFALAWQGFAAPSSAGGCD